MTGRVRPKDVGDWRNIEVVYPYVTWRRDIANDLVADVLVEDTGPRSPDDYWAHAELLRRHPGGPLWPVPKADAFIAGGDSWNEVVRAAEKWMRQNPGWTGEHGRYAQNPADREFSFGGEFW